MLEPTELSPTRAVVPSSGGGTRSHQCVGRKAGTYDPLCHALSGGKLLDLGSQVLVNPLDHPQQCIIAEYTVWLSWVPVQSPENQI